MSYTRISFGVVTRSDGGNANRRSAYQRCANDGEFDFSSKADELVDHGVILPEGADPKFADPETLWAAAEAAENRKDAQVRRTIEIAIPREVPEEDRRDLAEAILKEHFVSRGFAVEWSIHNPPALFEDDEQPHIHAAVTFRHIEGDQLAAKKDREFNSIMTRKAPGSDKKATFMRGKIADSMNRFFADMGIDAHVDPSPSELPPLPQASKSVLRQFERWKQQADKALKNGETNEPAQPKKVREFLEARQQALDAINELKALEREIAAAEKEEALANRVLEDKPSGTDQRNEGRDQRERAEIRKSDRADDRTSRADGKPGRGSARNRPDAESLGRPSPRTSQPSGTSGSHRRQTGGTTRDLQGCRRQVSANRRTRAANGARFAVDHAMSMVTTPTDYPVLDGDDPDAAARFLRQWSANYKMARP